MAETPSTARPDPDTPLTADEIADLLFLIQRLVVSANPDVDGWRVAQNAVGSLPNNPNLVIPDDEPQEPTRS